MHKTVVFTTVCLFLRRSIFLIFSVLTTVNVLNISTFLRASFYGIDSVVRFLGGLIGSLDSLVGCLDPHKLRLSGLASAKVLVSWKF